MRAESEDGGRQRKSFPPEELRGRRSRRSLSAAGRTPAGHHQGDGAPLASALSFIKSTAARRWSELVRDQEDY
ncbi:unnamed protein product [Tetraodon nigroviridis]|uniref:(spotted green pufferfish) hypothetical protein n=1 Tax=Tetraodon nigroviridis TaxID=99883 RepID=Q4ST54_TETNG|nr:unnamed protein product [Tetraodon nigroviridis]